MIVEANDKLEAISKTRRPHGEARLAVDGHFPVWRLLNVVPTC